VNAERETLSDYLRRIIRDKDLSYRKVAQRSGGRVSHATISDIINGRQKDIKTETLIGIARGLGVLEEELFAIARGKSVSGDLQLNELRLLEYFRSLSEESQEDVLTYLEMLSGRRGAMERSKGAKLPISSVFSQTSKRSSKKRAG
jgi:transcriptional regulator with XRE-family HTH domain